MPRVSCPYWQEYDSVSGPVTYCEVIAFNKELPAAELKKIGCTPEKREQCLRTMEGSVGLPPRTIGVPQTGKLPTVAFDAPPDIAAAVCDASKKKAALPLLNLFILGILAGAYIAIGAQLSNIVTNDLAAYLGDGFSRLMGGMVFSVGLVLVILCGAELFTGNNLVMALGACTKRVTGGQLLANWGIVFVANFVGSLLVVALIYGSGLWTANGALVGAKAVMTANAKVNLTWGSALCRGIMCNWLVCLAVWLSFAGRDAVSKILGIMLPIAAFVASGFEHSVANMYFIPMGITLSNEPTVLAALAKTLTNPGAALANLTWGGFFLRNLIPVTIGNIIGGAVFVGGAYWVAYLRAAKPKEVAVPVQKPAMARSTFQAKS